VRACIAHYLGCKDGDRQMLRGEITGRQHMWAWVEVCAGVWRWLVCSAAVWQLQGSCMEVQQVSRDHQRTSNGCWGGKHLTASMLGLIGDTKMVACIPGGGAVAERESACYVGIVSGVIVIAGCQRASQLHRCCSACASAKVAPGVQSTAVI
jgi:hypothetical protein